MKNRCKKTVSVLLLISLVLTLIPIFGIQLDATDNMNEFLMETSHLAEIPSGYTPIYNREGLDAIRENLGGNYILMNDIDMRFEVWTPIGTRSSNSDPKIENADFAARFSGIFDGNGYTIKNLDITVNETENKYLFAGLFATLSGEVKNLLLEGSVTAVGKEKAWAGSIAGFMFSGAKITNCVSKADITASASSEIFGGGIAGEAYGNISYCRNYGAVSAPRAGGIVGRVNGGNLYECHNTGAISASRNDNAQAGGITGDAYNSDITQCSNTGAVKVTSSYGVVAKGGGILSYSKNADVKNCWNGGNINVSSDISTDSKVSGQVSAGGICGHAENSEFEICYNIAEIFGKCNLGGNYGDRYSYAYSGGMVGYAISKVTIRNSFNIGRVSSNSYTKARVIYSSATAATGGSVGHANCDYLEILNFYNAGECTATAKLGDCGYSYSRLGGLIGWTQTSASGLISLKNSYWLADTAEEAIGNKGGSVTESQISSLTDEQMKQQDSFKGFSFGYQWTMAGDPDYEYPELLNLTYRKTNHICEHDSFGEWSTTRSATCLNAGEEMSECSICGTRKYKETEKLAHAWGEWQKIDLDSCTVHSVYIRKCSVCGGVETENRCDGVSDWIVDKYPTATENGLRYKKCNGCGKHIEEEVLPSPKHLYVKTVYAPTCDERGYTEMKCECGDSYRFDYKKPTGHEWSEWTLEQKSPEYEEVGKRTCAVCGKTEEYVDMPMIVIKDAALSVGNKAKVGVYLKNNPGISAISFSISYPSDKMQLKSAIPQKIFADYELNIDAGKYVFDNGGNAVEDGLLMVLEFDVPNNAPSMGYTVKITVNSCNNFETDNIDVYAVSGKVTGTGFKCGDLNGDDKIDSVDLILMRKYIAGYAVNIDIKAADLNCDGKINTVDLTLLRKYIAGYTVIFGK